MPIKPNDAFFGSDNRGVRIAQSIGQILSPGKTTIQRKNRHRCNK